MSEDKSVVKPAAAPPLAPLLLESKLAATPAGPPQFSATVKNAQGKPVALGDPRATRALVALMDLEAVNGGAACHWGGPSAFAEIMSAIHGLMFATQGRPWHEAYNFVNDAGHTENGVYALRSNYGYDGMTFADLKAFRSIHSKLTGHGESHLNPRGVLLSNGPLGSALPQAQGLAMADRLRKNDRVTICTVSDGASMEGEAKEAFAAIPGFAAKGKLNPFVMVVSDNDTKLSGRITADAFSMAPTFSAMSTLGWSVIEAPKGNDLQAVYLAVEEGIARARANPHAPVCVRRWKARRADTVFRWATGKRSSILSTRFIGEAGQFPHCWRTGRGDCAPIGKRRRRRKREQRPRRRGSRRTRCKAGWARGRCGPRRRGCRCIRFHRTWKDQRE
jgi:transketolase